MVQLMSLSPIISCFIKSRMVTILLLAYPGGPGKQAVNPLMYKVAKMAERQIALTSKLKTMG